MSDDKFADLAMLVIKAEARYKAVKSKSNFDRWNKLAREYSKRLRERLDAKWRSLNKYT